MFRCGRYLIAVAALAAFGAVSMPARSQPPPARTEEELAAARKVFADALRDQEDQRFAAALEGFRRVRGVRDTAPVEYRIGMCLEGLGRVAEAMAAYDAALRLSESDALLADVGTASHARHEALSRRLAHLTVTLSSPSVRDAEIRVDGKPQPVGDLVLDPGSHHVEATAADSVPFQDDVALPEGGRVSLLVRLDPRPTSSTGQPGSGEPRGGPESETGASMATWGWIAIGAGTALVAASVTSYLLRESDIRTANRVCPGGGCAGSIDSEALSATNRARIEGPLGLGLGVAGLVTAGLGITLMVTTPHRGPALSLVPTAGRSGPGLELRGTM